MRLLNKICGNFILERELPHLPVPHLPGKARLVALPGPRLEPAADVRSGDENSARARNRPGQGDPAMPGMPLDHEPSGRWRLAPEKDVPLLAPDPDEGETEGAVGGLGAAVPIEEAAPLGRADPRRSWGLIAQVPPEHGADALVPELEERLGDEAGVT